VHFSRADEQQAEAMLVGAGAPLVALHVGAGYPSKRWPLERYAGLAAELHHRHGATAVLVGGGEDLPAVQQAAELISAPLLVAAGRLGLRATAALFARCSLFVGNDSGPAHLAAAVGTPTLTLFSGENESELWQPRGPRCETVQKRPPCYPCGLHVCPRQHECMEAITVEEVLTAAERLMRPE